jgi:ERCC4-type nuclease
LTSDRQISVWRKKNPTIDETVTLLQSAALFEHRADIYRAMINVATSDDYKGHADRKLALEILGDYVPTAKLTALMKKANAGDDLSQLSDEELAKLAGMAANAGNSDDEADA